MNRRIDFEGPDGPRAEPGALARPELSAPARADVEWQVWVMRVREFKGVLDIARELGLTPRRVQSIIARTQKRLQAVSTQLAEVDRQSAIAQHEFLVQEAVQAWERSKGDKRQVTLRETGVTGYDSEEELLRGGTSDNVNRTTLVTEMAGDPRFLAEARAGLESISRLKGLEAPAPTMETQGKGSATVEVNIDQFDVVLNLLQSQGAIPPAQPVAGYLEELPALDVLDFESQDVTEDPVE